MSDERPSEGSRGAPRERRIESTLLDLRDAPTRPERVPPSEPPRDVDDADARAPSLDETNLSPPRPAARERRIESTLLDLRDDDARTAPTRPSEPRGDVDDADAPAPSLDETYLSTPTPPRERRIESTLLDLRSADARAGPSIDETRVSTPRPSPPRRIESTLLDLRNADVQSSVSVDETRISPGRALITPRPAAVDPTGALRESLAGAEESAAETEAPPARIGRFLVLRQLGRGGMGVVYAAYDDSLDRKVAIKLLRDQQADGADDRLLREAQALARLSHPNVVGVYEVDRALGSIYIAMEFVVGVTLREWLAERRRSREEILDVFFQAGRGLAAAHAVGLVHRDFKPDNVMVGDDGRVRVFDFGLARSVVDGEAPRSRTSKKSTLTPLTSGSFLSTDMTIAGTILGTPAYMSPEQFLAVATDTRTDIFSFCVALHEALYDQRPFAGATFDELRDAVCRGDLAPPPRDAGVPKWLRARLVRGLAPLPEDRWHSLDALLAALADDPIARARRWAKAIALVATIVAVALVTPVVISAARARMQAQAREEAAARRWEAIEARALSVGPGEAGAEAETLFNTFASSAEVRGTRALTEAWLARGRRFYELGDAERAMAAFASAYTGAPTPALERSTLLAIAGIFRERWDMGALAPLVDFLGDAEEDAAAVDPAVDALRIDVALDRRDFPAAAELVARMGEAAPDHLRGLDPALRALGHATSLGASADRFAALADVDGDGRDEIIDTEWPKEDVMAPATLRVRDRDGSPPKIVATYLSLRARRQIDGAPAFFLRTDDEEWSIVELSRDGAHERWRGPLPNAALAAVVGDLDGDGVREVYASLNAYRRGLWRFDLTQEGEPSRTPPRIVDETIDRLGSDVLDLAIADLDRDGRPELIAGLGAWRAYDLRVLRWAGAGYETVAHAEIGAAGAIDVIDGAGGERWVVAATKSHYRNRQLYPEPPHLAAPAGAHLLRLDGGAFTAGPTFAAEIDALVVGDLDGDGLDDLLYGVDPDDDRIARLFARRQRPDGEFVEQSLGLGRLVGVTQADDDPAVEVVLQVDDHLWLLGHGPRDTPVIRGPAPPARPPPPGLGDHALVAHWARADRLARLGLDVLAARSLLDLAELLDAPTRRSYVLERAAELFAREGDRRRAIEVLGELAGDRAVVGASRRLAATLHAAIGEYVAADAALREGGGVAVDARPFAPFTLGELALIGEPGRRTQITFDRPLDPAWRILRPATLRRDHVGGRLRLAAAELDESWAELPLLWDGGPILVRVDLEVEALEYGSSLQIELVVGDQRTSWGGIQVVGGAGHLVRTLGGPLGGIADLGEHSAEERQHLVITLACSPATDRQAVVIESNGKIYRRDAELQQTLNDTALTLRLKALIDHPDGLGQVRASIASIEVIGARPVADDDPRRRGRIALVDGNFGEAADLLAAAGPRDLAERLDLALALAELERWPEARAAVGDLADMNTLAAHQLVGEHLRARPAMRPILTELLGPRTVVVRMLSTGVPATQHAREPFARRILLEDYARLRGETVTDPELQGQALQLLVARAGVLREVGDLDEATLDLAAAEALAAGRAEPALALGFLREKARVLAARGDHEGARATLGQILELAIEPDLERARLSRDHALRGELGPVGPADPPDRRKTPP